ncbi:MAG TPA: TonB-dependent receptor [Limnobacter sp.]|nr:TonB-dependent receptor [Limnobacter sp.]
MKHPIFRLSAICAGVLIHFSALAETPTPTLDEVQVNASADASAEGLQPAYAGGQVAQGGRVGVLGSQKNIDTPFSTTAYTSELIENQQAASVGEVLLNDPAVRVARGFGNFQQLYLIRGYPIYSDDMAYNGLYGLLPRQYLASEFIERVEVIRGANAFLNGAAPGGSGLGGAISVVPKRAPVQDLNRVTTGLQTGGETLLAGDFARRSMDGNTGLRLNIAKREGDSAVDGEERDLQIFAVGLDHREGTLRVSADVGYQRHELTATQPSITIASGLAIPRTPDASRSAAQPWTFSNAEDVFGTVRAEYDFSEQLTAWAALGLRESEEVARFANPTVNNPNGDASAFRFDNVREDSVSTAEVGARMRFKTGSVNHTVSASVSTFKLESKNAFTFFNAVNYNIYNPTAQPMPAAVLFPGGNLNNPLKTFETETRSLALADTLGLMKDRLLLTLGARHQTIQGTNFNSTTGALLDAYDESRVTPVGGVVFKINHQTSLFANYIEALVQGGVAPATSGGTAVSNAGQIFKPYVTEQVEAGVKWDFGKLGATASVFQSDRPVYGVQGGVFGEVGQQDNTGLELTAYGVAFERLKVLGGLSFLDSKTNTGRDAIGSPDTQANLNLEWDFAQVQGLSAEGRLIYTSEQFADDANTQTVPSWTRLDLGLRYVMAVGQSQALTLRARLDNVTNRDYWASAGGFPGAGYLTVGAPRTFTVSASLDF